MGCHLLMSAELVNEVTGECILTDKEDRKYHLVFDMDAVMALEKITGKSAVDIISSTGTTDCVAMILCGHAGYQRRNPGGSRMNGNLAKKVFLDSGGYAKLCYVLAESLSRAEGMGFDDEGDDGGEPSGPLALPSS